ncbi:MAG TPA: hypothetical protein VIV88_18680 [Gemmatimonadales bacterium]|jgi:hypothetical protein
MAVIAYTDRGGVRSWVATHNSGAALRWTENIAEAAEFVDQAAVLTFLSGKDAGTVANGQIVTQTAGVANFGKKQH